MAKGNQDNKQKFIIIGALVVVLVGVGAFSLVGSSGGAPVPVAEKSAEEDPNKAVIDPNLPSGVAHLDENGMPTGTPGANERLLFTQRDPFVPSPIGGPSPDPNGTPPTPVAPPQPPAPAPGKTANNFKPSPLPPMNPMGGTFESLPNVGGAGAPGTISGNVASEVPSGPSYRLTGVISSDRPMAVISDNQGKQRIVEVGDSVDGKRVVAIKSGKLVLEERGKKDSKETLTLSENEHKSDVK